MHPNTRITNRTSGSQLITGTGQVTGEFVSIDSIDNATKFEVLTGNATGVANVTSGSAIAIPAGTTIDGIFTAIKLHAGTVDRLAQALILALGRRVTIGMQRPMHVPSHSEPQPDLLLLSPRDDFYTSRHPVAEDVLLVIEVADTSLQFDRTVKARLYAAQGIQEYWVIDARSRSIEVLRSPGAEGYADAIVLAGVAVVSPLAFPDCRWSVDELLG
jgi:Uma2 family endonuclease